MKIYDYYDTDETGHQTFDLCKTEYMLLLRLCFMYCSSVSFIVRSPSVAELVNVFDDQLPVSVHVKNNYQSYNLQISQIRHYRLTPRVQDAISKVTDSVFKWIDGWGYHNPEDLTFYRSDGSVFFTAIVHEGICSLYVCKDENVTSLLSNGRWIPRNCE